MKPKSDRRKKPAGKSSGNAKVGMPTEPAGDAGDANAEIGRAVAGFPVVGIGASAGGLAAFEAFFSGMPTDSDPGMAFVLVQHLAPDHKSILTDLVKRYTRMQVFEVEDGMGVKPNCAYIIPPNRDMALMNGTLQLLEPSAPRGMRLPIDFFFRSLARDQRERAICIVLSGTGSDGALGVRAVKGEGGMAMAQDLESADYDGMPRSAIATGLVDVVLPPKEMAAQLMAYASHAFGKGHRPEPASFPASENLLKKVCVLLRDQTGHDFSHYKENTLIRRIERRMALHQIKHTGDYVRYLRQTPGEATALFRDLLIGVTGFFRDQEAFAALETKVIPELFEGKRSNAPIRVWVCGCATGEEAYSIAILLQERLESLKKPFPVQVFATDMDNRSIEQARSGTFPASISADVPPGRLERFFTQDPGGGVYRIQKVIRDLIVFSEQDVIRDPPFSRLDLISCRNLLIYLNGDIQKKLISLFHYALNPKGFLFLGTSETVGELSSLFAPLERKWKLYQRQNDEAGLFRPSLGEMLPRIVEPPGSLRLPEIGARQKGVENLRDLVVHNLLTHYAQAAVLINGRGDVLHIYGRTGKYLEPAAGDANMNILTMARTGLRRSLKAALHRTVTKKQPVRHGDLQVRTNGDIVSVTLFLEPALSLIGEMLPDLFLAIFEEAPKEPEVGERVGEIGDQGFEVRADADRHIAALEGELRNKEEYLQSTIEEMETANEELKSTNEEMQSVNEELQSTNEELETSKEELQSVNEELATVNTELQTKVAELSRANNDMNNLLAGTGVATLFVDLQLCIVRFTPAATQLINLIATDIGRPVRHIVSNFMSYENLVGDLQAVLEDLAPREKEVQTLSGDWFLMRMRPYRTLENVIEGAFITFVNITEFKRARESVTEALAFKESVVDAVREPLVVLDAGYGVLSANRSFYRAFQLEPAGTVGRKLYELADGEWDVPELRRLLEEILPENKAFDDFRFTHDFKGIGRRTLALNARRIQPPPGQDEMILLAMEDITDSSGGVKAKNRGKRTKDPVQAPKS